MLKCMRIKIVRIKRIGMKKKKKKEKHTKSIQIYYNQVIATKHYRKGSMSMKIVLTDLRPSVP